MRNRQMVLMFVLLGAACVGCKTAPSGQSHAKDVPYVGDDLSTRFTIIEACEVAWQSATDAQCKIGRYVDGQLKREVPAQTIYKALDLDVPSGQAGEQETSKRQALVDRITSENAREAAQAVLDEFKGKIARKNALKTNLAKDYDGATCFDSSLIGDSGVLCSSLEAAMGGGGGGGGGTAGCPPDYVRVPLNTAVGVSADFCVAKYEMKNNGSGHAVSQAQGLPWVSIDRVEAIARCREIGAGYDLISNAQWQAVARSIESTPSNWSTRAVGSGSLSLGNFNSSGGLEAAANEIDPCVGTGESCSMTNWNVHRRAQTLSNGGVVWDIAGNALEWVKDNSRGIDDAGSYSYVSQLSSSSLKEKFGPQGNYNSLNSGYYGGLGILLFGSGNQVDYAVKRGGAARDADAVIDAGVFTVYHGSPDTSFPILGFRCVRLTQ